LLLGTVLVARALFLALWGWAVWLSSDGRRRRGGRRVSFVVGLTALSLALAWYCLFVIYADRVGDFGENFRALLSWASWVRVSIVAAVLSVTGRGNSRLTGARFHVASGAPLGIPHLRNVTGVLSSVLRQTPVPQILATILLPIIGVQTRVAKKLSVVFSTRYLSQIAALKRLASGFNSVPRHHVFKHLQTPQTAISFHFIPIIQSAEKRLNGMIVRVGTVHRHSTQFYRSRLPHPAEGSMNCGAFRLSSKEARRKGLDRWIEIFGQTLCSKTVAGISRTGSNAKN